MRKYEIFSCYRIAIITELLAEFSHQLSVSISFDKSKVVLFNLFIIMSPTTARLGAYNLK